MPFSVIHNIKFKEFFVDWYALGKVFLHSEATSSKFYRAVGTKLGLANCKYVLLLMNIAFILTARGSTLVVRI